MIKASPGYSIFKFLNAVFMILIVGSMLIPVLNILAKSFSDSKSLAAGTVTIWPQGFNVLTYLVILKDENFWMGYRNTVFYTLFGTLISLFLTTTFAYALASPKLKGKKFWITFVVVTMFFNGGIIPNFILIKSIGLRNTIWAILLPGALSSYNTLVMRTFFQNIPRELEEAAIIDGLDTYGILGRIILPLSKPILATMTLFYAVGAWNSWFGATIYLDDRDMQPVTVYLRNIIFGAMAQQGADADSLGEVAANIKAVTIMLTSLPIMCIYPFLQKYFVKGVMIGSVKG